MTPLSQREAANDRIASLKPGVYRHYKGPLYEVLTVAHDANIEDRIVVVYIGLQLNAAHEGPRVAVRSIEDFQAWVDPTSGESVLAENAVARHAWAGWRPRFEWLGYSFHTGMLEPATTGDPQ